MKAFSFRTFTPWWMALLSLLVLAGCGSDDNPISPTASQLNQVNSVNSQVPQNVFSGTLNGTEQVPSVTSNGTGAGIVSVDPATNEMKASIVTTDINGQQAHIHLGARGVTGPVVFPMTESEAGSGVWTTTVTLTTDQLDQLKTGNYYFNVHTAAFPEGEIRGQILAQLPQSGSVISTTSTSTDTSGASSTSPVSSVSSGITSAPEFSSTPTTGTSTGMISSGSSGVGGTQASGMGTDGTTSTSTLGTTAIGGASSANAAANRAVFYTNVLSGSLAVPPNTSTASAAGIAAYRPNNRTLTAVVISRGLTATGASIRQAAAGTAGPVIASFTETSVGSGIWVLRATLTPSQAEALNNGAMYYELLSPAFLQGELRGQIVRTLGATTPGTPATPATPATPVTSATPVTPATTATPATSTAPTTPATPSTPTMTTTPASTMPTTPAATLPPTTTTTPTTAETTAPGTTTPITTTPTATPPTTTIDSVATPTETTGAATTDATSSETTPMTGTTTTTDPVAPTTTDTTMTNPTVAPITTITDTGVSATTP